MASRSFGNLRTRLRRGKAQNGVLALIAIVISIASILLVPRVQADSDVIFSSVVSVRCIA